MQEDAENYLEINTKISTFTTHSNTAKLTEYQNQYCEAALFRCNCCNYETEIYYNEEFLEESEEKL